MSGSSWNIRLFQSLSDVSDNIVSIELNILNGSCSNTLGVYLAKSKILIV